jgi:hypothetical protein
MVFGPAAAAPLPLFDEPQAAVVSARAVTAAIARGRNFIGSPLAESRITSG